MSGDETVAWLAAAQTTAQGVVALLLFLVMWVGGFFVARGIVRVGRPLVEGALADSRSAEGGAGRLGRHGSRDLLVGFAIIGVSAVVAAVTFAVW
jgi:hypothetical protein